MKLEKIDGSYLYYNEEHRFFIRQYYLYCKQLIADELSENDAFYNVILGDYLYWFRNKNKTFKIDIQFEHTLVKPGGRDSEKALISRIKFSDENHYLIRIPNLSYYESLDYVIDYSIPNFINVSGNNLLKQYYDKLIVISPLLFPFNDVFATKDAKGGGGQK